MVQLALYKGPPSDFGHKVGHYLTRLWTWSKYSHAELHVDNVCYSSSNRDGGVRSKAIDLANGRWDVVTIPNADASAVVAWFNSHDGDSYDWPGIIRWVMPIIRQHKRRWTCYEACATALGLAGAHKLDADDLLEWAQR